MPPPIDTITEMKRSRKKWRIIAFIFMTLCALLLASNIFILVIANQILQDLKYVSNLYNIEHQQLLLKVLP